jgi:hypothetical protein
LVDPNEGRPVSSSLALREYGYLLASVDGDQLTGVTTHDGEGVAVKQPECVLAVHEIDDLNKGQPASGRAVHDGAMDARPRAVPFFRPHN